MTKQNRDACETEAIIYRILGSHPRIANCISITPDNQIELEYYPHDNLKAYISRNGGNVTELDRRRWAHQMIESVAYIHSKGIRHSDLRLEQWLVDTDLNARLGDFDAAGFDDQPELGLKARRPSGLETWSHYLPRDPESGGSVYSDIFALGSSLYELSTGHQPYEAVDGERIQSLFESALLNTPIDDTSDPSECALSLIT
ncbi:kinase-like protein [Westerdykella ornata]|uniref:Kinase-like protein n=1 Tax=Westerdykella ornata TaxID=318751 RepID=A0A6A6JE60_WESOR|nr:kinase-like protein [Westerdykella ornata]KAF2273469.1 kinase-like protein [Westerdykella ornata]